MTAAWSARDPTGSRTALPRRGCNGKRRGGSSARLRSSVRAPLGRRLRGTLPPSGSVRINGLLEMPYSPDTGADKSVVPRDEFDSLRAMQPSLQAATLLHAVEAVMADGRTQLCDQEVLLDLELAGRVTRFLLGRDVLKGLGIDVEQQLAQLAGPSLLEDETDEFPVGDAIPVPQDAAGLVNGFAPLLDRAAANGMPPEHLGTLREILEIYPDVWEQFVSLGERCRAGTQTWYANLVRRTSSG
ncbi:hypothetical protein PHYSODRAFT_307114 [Phytophthora sojae]|uniref:Uncharacterized protein n=1 Tax=Phytophthora sojae (strain P6497) TaxID=1094619 RepID=G5ACS8_PHYSP|nr:hypothetical protein PHYSODRAFT_307114 [Phytophthora sojae]EGZ07152.1 hypothetical protein PHYSODRAFT_307114 [Phytophthora sojae]|eukprot:XP_009537916.1 hypothetical protein PHYSODRAFT_307114 [Phytophthora sojae]